MKSKIKTFEQYNENDPFDEENWDDDVVVRGENEIVPLNDIKLIFYSPVWNDDTGNLYDKIEGTSTMEKERLYIVNVVEIKDDYIVIKSKYDFPNKYAKIYRKDFKVVSF
jgi:hypothetical protein